MATFGLLFSFKFVKIQSAEAYQKVSKALMELLELFKTGEQKLQNFVDDVWKEIVEWFLKNKKVIENTFKKYFPKSGSGGILKYSKIISRDVYKQEEWMSCAAATIRQLAKGILLSEKEIRLLAKTTETGTSNSNIFNAMKAIFKENNITAKTYFKHTDDSKNFKEMIQEMANSKFITNVGLPPNRHNILVDKVVGNKVIIKDPWPIEVDKAYELGKRGIELEKVFNGVQNGVVAEMQMNDFMNAWIKGGNIIFKID